MAEPQDERPEEAGGGALACAGRGPSDAKALSWRTLAISVVVAVALSVTTMLLLGDGSLFVGRGASGACCGGSAVQSPGQGGVPVQ